MSTYEQSYCNTSTDLTSVVTNIAEYDQKRLISNWSVHSGSVYKAKAGYISVLYKNGLELGAAEASLGDVDAADEWYYDSAADVVYFYNAGNSPNEDTMEAGVDWETLKTRIVGEQAERIRSYIDRPILSRKGVGTESDSDRQWDWILIRGNALLACAYLIGSQNLELSDELERQAIDPDRTGLLDRLKDGEYKLWNETEYNRIKGLREVSIDNATTATIIDVKGKPTSTDLLKIQIQTGGTLQSGSASSVTYSVWGGDSTGIKISQIIDSEIITGGWDIVTSGVSVRWSAGVLTANDEWELELMGGEAEENPAIKTLQARR